MTLDITYNSLNATPNIIILGAPAVNYYTPVPVVHFSISVHTEMQIEYKCPCNQGNFEPNDICPICRKYFP